MATDGQQQRLGEGEELFRTLADFIPQLAWMADPDGHITWYNRRFLEYTGASFESMQGWGWQSVHDPAELPKVLERWNASLATGDPFEMTFPLKGNDGSYRQFLTRVQPVKDDEGRVTRWFGTNTDVTEAKRAEEEVREARSRLESTLASGEIGTWEYDVVNNVVWADRNLARMYGLSEEQSNPIEQYLPAVHPEDRDRVTQTLIAALKSGERYEAEYRLIGPDGVLRWVVARGRVERNSAGRAVRMPGVIVDVTERKAAEERERLLLAEASTANAKFRAFFDQGPLFAGIMTLAGVIVEPNRLSLEACGYTRDQVVGKPFWECPWWSPSPLLSEQIKHASQQAAQGQFYRAELPYFVADGSERMVDLVIMPIKDEAGNVLFLAPTGTDITDRKQVEEDRQKFVTLAESVTDFIAMFDMSGVPIYVNQAGLTMVGLDDLNQVLRTPLREFFFPEDQQQIVDVFLPQVLSQGHAEIEVRFRHFKTAAALWMLYKVVVLVDSQGQQVGLATVSRDITQRRELEDNLRLLASDLSEANHRKDEFLATLAHELRNPLAPIRNCLQTMKVAQGDAAIIEQARAVMERQVVQMVRLVDDLLDVSRITRGKIDLRREHVDLSSILQQAVETSRPAIETASQRLTIALPPEPLRLHGDPVRLVQVFSNLLNNSCKYSERGGHITIAATREAHEVVVSVKDTGIGILRDMLPRIFEMFTQIDRSLDRSEGGLGIGLTLVKRLVELHNGAISAASEGAGKGSEFIVRLPFDQESSENPTPRTAGASKPTTARRILVVDDNRDSAMSLATLLKLTGNETQTAFDGLAAIEAATAFLPQVILLDIGLPRLNGYEVARKIREQPWGQSMILVALTGWGQDEDRQKSKDAGFNAHMVKPVDHAALAKLLNELLPPSM